MLVILLVGLGIRVANVLWWRPIEVPPKGATEFTPRNPRALVLGGDGFFYHYQALALAEGDGFADPYRWRNLDGDVQPSAAHPPAYPVYLAAWSLVGVRSPTGHRLVTGLLGLVTIGALGLTGRRIAGEVAGFAAAGFAAVYPSAWINDTMLLSEGLAQAAVAAFLYCAYRLWRSPTWGWAAGAGLAAGVATLTRNEQIVLFAVVVLLVTFAVREVTIRQRVVLAAAAAVAGLLLITPWAVRNLVTFNRTTILTTGAGAALSAANCDATYSGELLGWYANCFQGPWPDKTIDASGRPIEVDAEGRPIDESDRDVEPLRQARAYIADHLGRQPVVVAARVGRLWGWFRPIQSTRFEIRIESRGATASWLGLAALYVLQVTGVAGLVVMRRGRIPISPVIALVAVATFGAAITFGVARYRSTAEVGLLLASGVAIAAAVRQRDQSASMPTAARMTQTTSAPTR
jgi:4-amino-4-deoxy-L-arabinose transferase-like glycosyltransferase